MAYALKSSDNVVPLAHELEGVAVPPAVGDPLTVGDGPGVLVAPRPGVFVGPGRDVGEGCPAAAVATAEGVTPATAVLLIKPTRWAPCVMTGSAGAPPPLAPRFVVGEPPSGA